MKERSILFSAEMVKAILDGRKTQTRRVVKSSRRAPWRRAEPVYLAPGQDTGFSCPYGAPGDRLWVRETWRPCYDDGSGTAYRADPHHSGAWKPSIYMPRNRSRITLEVTHVRVQRVQNISVDDIEAEGVAIKTDMTGGLSTDESTGMAYDDWRNLWDSINAKRGYGWDVNPWVWAITFKRIERGDE